MNRHFLLFSFFFFAIVLNIHLYGQTQEQIAEIKNKYNQETLEFLDNKFQQEYIKQQQEAYIYAREHNLKTLIVKEDGSISTLQRIAEDGTPIYYTTYNAGAATTTRADELYSTGSLGLNVEGQGMTIGVWDGGAVRASHELLEGRVNQLDNPQALSSHATHVSGTMIGASEPQGGAARGMSFRASLNAFDYNNDISEMVDQAMDGLLISNHSYGIDAEDLPDFYFGYYDYTSKAIDELAYYAPYYLIVNAGGNDRGNGYNSTDNGHDLLAGMAVAKNNLTVAAVQEVTNYTGPSSVQMSSFSSWGPTDDGRIKPDISGKGVNVYSSTSDSDNSYAYYSGTSMASPNVAGSLLLLQQLSQNLEGSFLKSATLKALAIHAASEAGDYDGPDYEFGWGLLDTESAAQVLLEKGFTSFYEEKTLGDGQNFIKNVNAVGDTLKVTIVWTDPKGSSPSPFNYTEDDNTPRLVNDLDVRVEDENGNIFYPWMLDPQNPQNAATTGDNVVDNVEKVEILNAQGEYTITVGHKGSLVSSQDYTIVITGISESEFAFTPDNTSKSFCPLENAEFIFNLVSDDDYLDQTDISITGLPAGLTATFSSNPVLQDGPINLTITGLDMVVGGEYNFTVTAEGGDTEVIRQMTLIVLDEEPINNISILSPQNNATNVSIYPIFNWTGASGVDHYTIEISEDSNFNSVFFSRQLENTSLQVPELLPETTYYWRVQAENLCYSSNFAEGEFTTEGIDCSAEFFSIDPPINISDNSANTQTATINFTEDVSIKDINVRVDISHTYLEDLEVYLTSPEGTQINLVSQACGNGNNIDVVFDDYGLAPTCTINTPTLSGMIKPEDELKEFVGENALGEWTLTVVDIYEEDGGVINDFGIEVCAVELLSTASQKLNDLQMYPNPASDHVFVNMHNIGEDVTISVFDINGRRIITNNFEASPKLQLDVSSLQDGVYFVEVISGNLRETRKLIIN